MAARPRRRSQPPHGGGAISDSFHTAALVERFLGSFNSGDLGAMRAALADDAVAFVTGPDGNPMRLDGADMYIAALGAMDLANVDYSVDADPGTDVRR